MSLALVAYPDIPAEDLDWIQSVRRRHDPNFAIVDAHFSFVFPLSGMAEAVFTAHVTEVLATVPPIAFVLRTATMVVEPGGDRQFVFLVPDAGHDAMTALHRRLYTGPLEPHLRPKIPFVPHLTVARTGRRAAAQAIVGSLGRQDFAIAGHLHRFAAIEVRDGGVREMTELALDPALNRGR